MSAVPARTVFIGLDACDTKLAREFAAAGAMPVLAKLLDTAAVQPTLGPYGWLVALVLDGAPDIAMTLSHPFLHLVEHRVGLAPIPNSGALTLRRGEESRRFLEAVWKQRRFLYHRWWENGAINHLLGYRTCLGSGCSRSYRRAGVRRSATSTGHGTASPKTPPPCRSSCTTRDSRWPTG